MSGGGRRCTSPVSPSTMIGSPASTSATMSSSCPTAGDAERARDDGDVAGRPALLQHQAAQPLRGRSRAARPAPCVRATMMASSGRSPANGRAVGPSARAAAGWRDRRNRAAGRAGTGSVWRGMRARVSFCTRSTAASAVRPVAHRLLQPPRPAAVLGEHLVGFEHLAVLAACRPRRRARAGRRPRARSSPSPRRGASARARRPRR